MPNSSKKPTAFDLSDIMYSNGIHFISGKWFVEQLDGTMEEIKKIDRYILSIPQVRTFSSTVNDLNNIKDAFIVQYGEDKTWTEMPIVKEARELEELQPLCFPLTEKQLLFINRIISGEEEMMFILCGVGGSGKSTFANIIKQIFSNDVGSLNLSDLSNDFKLATGIDKRLIYSDELNSEDINNGIIKTLVSKQCVNINPKYEKGFNIRWQGTLLFSCNKPPRLDLSDSGIVRRICYFSMNEKISNPDHTLQKKEYTHEELVNIVAHALRVDTTDWFSKFQSETREILRTNNSVWICIEGDLEHTDYSAYTKRTNLKGLRTLSEPRWQEIKDLLLDWDREEKGYSEDELPF